MIVLTNELDIEISNQLFIFFKKIISDLIDNNITLLRDKLSHYEYEYLLNVKQRERTSFPFYNNKDLSERTYSRIQEMKYFISRCIRIFNAVIDRKQYVKIMNPYEKYFLSNAYYGLCCSSSFKRNQTYYIGEYGLSAISKLKLKN